MHRPRWSGSPRYTPVVFLGAMCILGGALIWLCWQLLEQDRQLEAQRAQERLEKAADRTAGALETSLRDLDLKLPRALDVRTEPPPPGVMLLIKGERGVNVNPPGQLLYLPPSAPTGKRVDNAFAAGERLEFRWNDPAGAAESFRDLAAAPDAEVRAGALLRLGRNLRKLRRYQEALGIYSQLALLQNVAIEGVPVELTALDARCTVLEAMGRRAELTKEALRMDTGLRSCRWQLPGPAWDFHRAEARRWASTPTLGESERKALAFSRAAEWLCKLWPQPLEPKGRRVLNVENGPVLVSWSADADRLAAILVGPDRLAAVWRNAQAGPGVRAALVDANGNVVIGSVAKNAQRAVRSPAVPGLFATLLLTSSDPVADLANSAIRRRFLLAGFAVLALVLTASSYVILRSMARENAVARMQSEFVTAVSHEFRTPLTSLRQLSEMLAQDRIPGEAARRLCYDAMFHASERLQRLVESLLDFGRMEAAAFRYRFDEVDLGSLVGRVVEEFRRQAASEGYQVNLTQAEDLPPVRADREAIGVAVWNLLDNAVKYSPDCRTVWVETTREGTGVGIAVRDNGLGIEANEQDRIFDKFVRGSAAWKSNVKGTGIGLSMARHIVRAHGGEIRLASEPGRGSTFTIFIPVETEA